MKVKLFGLGIVLLIGWVVINSRLNEINEEAVEAYEEDDFCKAFETFAWKQHISRSSKDLLATIYAGGLCPDQNLSRAIQLWSELYGTDQGKIAQSLFYTAQSLRRRVHKKQGWATARVYHPVCNGQ